MVARRAAGTRHGVGVGRGPGGLGTLVGGQIDGGTVAIKVVVYRPELVPSANFDQPVIVEVVVNQHRSSLRGGVVKITGKRRQCEQQDARAH